MREDLYIKVSNLTEFVKFTREHLSIPGMRSRLTSRIFTHLDPMEGEKWKTNVTEKGYVKTLLGIK